MKQQVVDRARSVVEALLRKQYPDGALAVLLVKPDVDGYGDELLWIYLKYDDNNPKSLPEPLARLRLKVRLRDELRAADVEASPVVSFVAESDVGVYLNEDATVMPC